MGVRGACGMWPSETYALFIKGVKIMSHMKEYLTQQLLQWRHARILHDKRELGTTGL
jgi:hypothetical protein